MVPGEENQGAVTRSRGAGIRGQNNWCNSSPREGKEGMGGEGDREGSRMGGRAKKKKESEREIEAKREGENQTDTDRQIHLKNPKYIFSINFLPFEKKEYRGKLSLLLLMYRFIFSLTK